MYTGFRVFLKYIFLLFQLTRNADLDEIARGVARVRDADATADATPSRGEMRRVLARMKQEDGTRRRASIVGTLFIIYFSC